MPPVKAAEAAAPAAPAKGAENPEVNNLLSIAQDLRDEKVDLFSRIDANRQILRNYGKLGYLSGEQVSAIEAFYPPHRQKAAEETPDAAPAEK